MAEQLAHLARLVIVIHDELPRHPATDGAPPALPLIHGVVVREGGAIFGFQVYHPDSLRIFAGIFAGIFAALFKATPLAYWLYAIQTRPVFVELRERLIDAAVGADATFRLGITSMIVMLLSTALFASVP
jgi:hypothetical protein